MPNLTDAEVTDRIADIVRGTQMIVEPDGTVTIFAEDKERELPGKFYLFMIKLQLKDLRDFLDYQLPNASPPE